MIPFKVTYWHEILTFDWAPCHLHLYICWGARLHCTILCINKYPLIKMFGVFRHTLNDLFPSISRLRRHILRTHSRHTTILGMRSGSARAHHSLRIGGCRSLYCHLKGRSRVLCDRSFGVFSPHPAQRVPAGYGKRDGHSGDTPELLQRQRPESAAVSTVAFTCQPALHQLVELLRIPGHPL